MMGVLVFLAALVIFGALAAAAFTGPEALAIVTRRRVQRGRPSSPRSDRASRRP